MNTKKKTLIVGAGWAGQTMAETLVNSGTHQVVGFVDDLKDTLDPVNVMNGVGEVHLPILDTSHKIVETAVNTEATDVVLAITHDRKGHVLEQVVKCYEEGLRVHQMPDMYSDIKKRIPIKHIDHSWIVPRLKPPAQDLNTFLVSVLDYTVSLLLIVCVFLPLFPFVAAAIKLTSPGPLYFLQKRVGRYGRRFTILKFRTMTNKARSEGASWTTEGDARITSIGSFLRKYRIDELPQLINVLKGEMALIGPRPEAVDLVALYRKEIPFYEYRYLVKPGITGWAQVEYKNTCSVEGALKKLQYDLYWIKKRSLWLSLKIIAKTIKVSLTGFGSV
ncbi:MAG: sugar transferase [Planctomycetes bacterium]|nr:sugar transferase [Planctomycetota bacterium]